MRWTIANIWRMCERRKGLAISRALVGYNENPWVTLTVAAQLRAIRQSGPSGPRCVCNSSHREVPRRHATRMRAFFGVLAGAE